MRFGYIGKTSSQVFAVTALTMLASLLRLQKIWWPIWGDEADTFDRHAFAPMWELLSRYFDPNQHTLFSILSNLCMKLFGENEFGFRFPSFLSGILAIPLLYRLGLYLLDSKAASLVASCLLVFSTIHLNYSQNGRGYALTVFLALVLTWSATKIALNKNVLGSRSLLVVSGLCLVLTLPSNAFFLAATTAYCLAIKWDARECNTAFPIKSILSIAAPFLILLLFVAGYFALIYVDLISGINKYSPHVPKGMAHIVGTAKLLISPWSHWCYLLFAYGIVSLVAQKKVLPFLAIFIVPWLLTWITGIVGYSRIYIYLLPFVLMVIAQGIVAIASQIMRLSSLAGYMFVAVVAVGMLANPVLLQLQFPNRTGVTIAEAKQALIYAQESIPHSHLILVPSDSSALSHYLEKRIKKDMFSFVTGSIPGKIILMVPKEIPPENYEFDPYYPPDYSVGTIPSKNTIHLPAHDFKLINTIGNLHIYELGFNIFRFLPASFDPDYETKLNFQDPQIHAVENPKVLGIQALMAEKPTYPDSLIASPVITPVDITAKEAYLLSVYVRNYGQKSKALLVDHELKEWPPSQMVYLNKYMGQFELPGSDVNWQMLFILSPIAEGHHDLQEIIDWQDGDEAAYFDAVQSFVLIKR